jgi:DNA polymerase I
VTPEPIRVDIVCGACEAGPGGRWQAGSVDAVGLVEALYRSGTGRGDPVALAVDPTVGLGVATAAGSWSSAGADGCRAVEIAEEALHPRWVLWSNESAVDLGQAGVRVATAWDVAAVHRLLFGGWAAGPAQVWAAARGLALDRVPTGAAPNLFTSLEDDSGDPEDPVRTDGYLRPEWVAGGWRTSPERLRHWAVVATKVAALQLERLSALRDHPMASVTARSESAAELLCAEMTLDGLPMDRSVAEAIIAGFIGPRPSSNAEAAAFVARRDAEVLRHVPPGVEVDLRSSAQVKALLGRLGVQVSDTRAWRLRTVQDRHPVVGAFLEWRKVERVATTYGYVWLDRHLGADGRFRGSWTACDGAAGRMTASAGLHNMPADLRPAVRAEPGNLFVRADLGQIEPRVLAAVSRDDALVKATLDDDLYLPVAAQLTVERATAKVAVLGAMYGQTTGHGAQALRRLAVAYPVAMAYLERAARAAEAGRDLHTHGGRLVRMSQPEGTDGRVSEAAGVAAARGRYGRNAVIQGAAAELFKTWAVTVRARAQSLGASIVLCLHDELLVQVPVEHAQQVARLVEDCLDEAAHRWAPGTSVRFVADVSVIERWSDAKPATPSENLDSIT